MPALCFLFFAMLFFIFFSTIVWSDHSGNSVRGYTSTYCGGRCFQRVLADRLSEGAECPAGGLNNVFFQPAIGFRNQRFGDKKVFLGYLPMVFQD